MARVLLTGCSTGIGRATALELTARGHYVIASARRAAALADLPVARKLQLDVCDAVSVAAAVEASGEIDVLVNNAGLAQWAPLELVPIEEVQRLFDTNVVGAVRMCQAVLPQMRERGRGRIVQVSSGAARRPQPAIGLYGASKAALEAFSMAARIECRAFGVDFVLVSMGAIQSNLDRNRYVCDAAGTDYAPMMARIVERSRAVRDIALPAEAPAKVIADVVEAAHPPFRTYVGADYAESVEAMARMSDEAFEEQVFGTIRDVMPKR